ncbi:MAG: hypothetical protein RLY43_927 [Bacteroidota bacterium]|jgi:hypothetical protein
MEQIEKVSIALQPSVYTTFRALNNTVALTLSEYVDNSLQSYLSNKDKLFANNPAYSFVVSIEIDNINSRIIIKDNAAGIDNLNYLRAFEPANIPLDNSKLNEFGMGMKTASVWLADIWSVRTKAIGESVERYTEFNLHKVIEENREDLLVEEADKDVRLHYTEIILSKLSHNSPTSHQLDKIRRHLASIYRYFIRNKDIILLVNGETLNAPEYEILRAPFYSNPNGDAFYWKKEIDFEFDKYKAKGFIGILNTITKNANGLVLLRRGRVIVGGEDDRAFPPLIFGSPGNFRYKRLFGEIELEGFDVSFNKNKFIGEKEKDLNAFLGLLKDELKDPEFNLFSQADNYRVKSKEDNQKIAQKIAKSNKNVVNHINLTAKTNKVENALNDPNVDYNQTNVVGERALETLEQGTFKLDDQIYRFSIDLVAEENNNSLYSVSQPSRVENGEKVQTLICKINLSHPFFIRFEQFKNANDYEPIMAIFKSFALAEFISTKKSIQYPSEMRTYFNEYIIED